MITRNVSAVLWLAAALAACLSVTVINGGGLSYFDTAGYLEQGKTSLTSFGLLPDTPAGDTGAGDGTGAGAEEDDGVVIGSRSAIYSTLVAALHFSLGLIALPVLQALIFLAALALPVHLLRRLLAPEMAFAPALALPVLVASLGALPFYVAYMMPDIFAPILLLMLATLGVFASEMTWGERGFAVLLGMGAVVTHPSHLLIAALMVPIVALAALILSRRGWWLPPALAVLVVLGGMGERLLFASAVKAIQGAEVVYQPFLTVRVIADGPGYAYLEDTCPDEQVPTCALYAALQTSDDPYRLTASHIMFETSQRLGSYRLLPQEDQKRVARDQVGFFLSVLMARPLDTVQAFAGNTLTQAARFQSIAQTVPDQGMLDHVYRISDLAPAILRDGRLVGQGEALAGWLDRSHQLLYSLSLLVILWLCLRPAGDPPTSLRLFALLLVAGILANALVCGGISQPSDRYGARVAFLMPLAATLLLMVRGRAPVTGSREIR